MLPEQITSADAAEVQCQQRCGNCSQCRFISWSAKRRDCSWFARCELTQLKNDVKGFLSARATHSSRLKQHAPRQGKKLSRVQRLDMKSWIARIDPKQAMMVQIGANDHAKTTYRRAGDDPGPMVVQLGWKALLVEPNPPVFKRLSRRYVGNERVRTLNPVAGAHGLEQCAKDGHVGFFCAGYDECHRPVGLERRGAALHG